MKTSVQQLMRFCSVGAVGFMVDTSITLLLVRLASAAPVWARIAAFICGASVTWMLNKHFTFRAEGGFKRWTMYMSLTAIGALLNVGVYALWI